VSGAGIGTVNVIVALARSFGNRGIG